MVPRKLVSPRARHPHGAGRGRGIDQADHRAVWNAAGPLRGDLLVLIRRRTPLLYEGERVFVPHAPESFRRRYRTRRLSRALHHRTVPRCAGGEKRLLRGRIGESNRLGFCLLTYRLIHRVRQRPGGRQEQSHHMVKLPLRVDRNASGAGRLSAHVVALTSKPPTSGRFCQIA